MYSLLHNCSINDVWVHCPHSFCVVEGSSARRCFGMHVAVGARRPICHRQFVAPQWIQHLMCVAPIIHMLLAFKVCPSPQLIGVHLFNFEAPASWHYHDPTEVRSALSPHLGKLNLVNPQSTSCCFDRLPTMWPYYKEPWTGPAVAPRILVTQLHLPCRRSVHVAAHKTNSN